MYTKKETHQKHCLFFAFYLVLFVFSVFIVLERKISMRRPRQELIDKGVLKEISENGTSAFRRHYLHTIL